MKRILKVTGLSILKALLLLVLLSLVIIGIPLFLIYALSCMVLGVMVLLGNFVKKEIDVVNQGIKNEKRKSKDS
jgi:uncharacterized membrane protein